MTPERISELATQADAYATVEYDRTWTAGLFNKDRWQSIRDIRFAQLVRNEVLEECAAVCDQQNPPLEHQRLLSLYSAFFRGKKS